MHSKNFENRSDVRTYLLDKLKENKEVTGINIIGEKDIKGCKYWQYSVDGWPFPRTRNEHWINQNGEQFSIFQCFKHNIEDVASKTVSNPFHDGDDDKE